MKTRMAGFQKPANAETKPVGLAILRVGHRQVYCSCGWQFHHQRTKVLEDRAETHANRRHAGRAVWM